MVGWLPRLSWLWLSRLRRMPWLWLSRLRLPWLRVTHRCTFDG
ncbi:MAG: hypothetical protein ACR65T_16325 [Methylocystis sp.]